MFSEIVLRIERECRHFAGVPDGPRGSAAAAIIGLAGWGCLRTNPMVPYRLLFLFLEWCTQNGAEGRGRRPGSGRRNQDRGQVWGIDAAAGAGSRPQPQKKRQGRTGTLPDRRLGWLRELNRDQTHLPRASPIPGKTRHWVDKIDCRRSMFRSMAWRYRSWLIPRRIRK